MDTKGKETLLFTKVVDQSVLYAGISIPLTVRQLLFEALGFDLKKGEQVAIPVLMDGYIYDGAIIKNQYFDGDKYPNRSDIVQLRYSGNSLIAKALRETFALTEKSVEDYMETREDKKSHLVIPEEEREYIAIYAVNGMLRFDCISRKPNESLRPSKDFGEEAPQRRETVSSGFKRNANVIEEVRRRADGICQLCGEPAPFNDKQGKPYLEVHHVVWLSRGGADKVSNAVALCPNCHSKMHIVDDEKDIELLLEKAQG